MAIASMKKKMVKYVVATISDNEYKHVFLSKKYLRHLINRIQKNNHRTGTYEINKILLSCFDDKIYSKNWI